MLDQKDKLRLIKLANILYKASRKVRILSHLNWPSSVRYNFFRSGSEKLPNLTYPPFDPSPIRHRLNKAMDLMGDTPFDQWFKTKLQDKVKGLQNRPPWAGCTVFEGDEVTWVQAILRVVEARSFRHTPQKENRRDPHKFGSPEEDLLNRRRSLPEYSQRSQRKSSARNLKRSLCCRL